MSGLIPQRFIEELLDRVDLVDVVGSRVNLKKSGASFKACCPFHDEKTPSFHVRPDKGFYHCFGCGAHGDAISFIREYDGLSFTDAVEELAGRQGLEVPYDKAAREEMRQMRTLTGALDDASAIYQRLLQAPEGHSARDYLANRGIDTATAERFALGYAPPTGDALTGRVDKSTLDALITTRAVSDKYGRPRDLFRNRLMFPIRNPRGRTVAFGGRTLGDDKAKYINSPESEVYHKSQTIYGLYEAQQANRHLDRLLVVEGYTDVIALSQHGVTEAVAASGTATNQDSMQTLLRHTRHIIFCFDGDTAGYRAADRALENALELLSDGIHIQFLMLPEGEDPDTLIRQEGEDAFRQRIDAATPLSRQLFNRQSEGLDLNLPEHRGELRARVEPLLRKMPRSTLREAMWNELHRLCGRREFQRDGGRGTRPGQPANSTPDIRLDRDTMLCAALFVDPSLADETRSLISTPADLPRSHAFAQWLCDQGIGTQGQILLRLATHPDDQAAYADLFNRIEHFPSIEACQSAGRDILRRLEEEQGHREASDLLNSAERISELTPEEKERLREMMKRRQAQKPH